MINALLEGLKLLRDAAKAKAAIAKLTTADTLPPTVSVSDSGSRLAQVIPLTPKRRAAATPTPTPAPQSMPLLYTTGVGTGTNINSDPMFRHPRFADSPATAQWRKDNNRQ